MIPYMHIQGAHDLQMTRDSHPYNLGQLRYEVMERTHREMKILNSNQGGGRGVAKENRGVKLRTQIYGPTQNSQDKSYNFTQKLKNETVQKWLATVNAFINQKYLDN